MLPIAPGAIVTARARRHLVVNVDDHDGCRSVRLAPIDEGGQMVTLLHPFDRIDVLPVVATPKRAGRRSVARACAAAVRASYRAGETRTMVDARAQLLPYQLEPALAIVRGQATRVLLADEVGLGKTIQAALILSELRARQMLRRALILTPAGLRQQWAEELRERFGMETTVMDAGSLGALQRTLPPWVNAWTLPGIVLASIDLLKRDELLRQLEHVLWDAVVVDEAHHATRGTDRRLVAALACSRARVVVLVTATPHNGNRSAFEELCALGSLDAPGEPPLRIYRRLRTDTQNGDVGPGRSSGIHGVAAIRRTRLIRVRRSSAEQRMDATLRAYTGRVWREAGPEARLAMVVLRKRALSGAASLARSVARRMKELSRMESGSDARSQLSFNFTDTLEGEVIEDDCEPARELAAPGLADTGGERQLLAELLDSALMARRDDSKADHLSSAVAAAREPVIIFTEYRDTLEDLRRRLADKVAVVLLHGAMMPAERHRSMKAFETGHARVLLATDAAAEGLNLQRCCRWVVHYEVPWNPVRIEQRNGRVDRIGQVRRVHCWHFVAGGTEEETVLARVAARSSLAALDLGDEQTVVSAVFGNALLALPSAQRARRAPSTAAVEEAARVAMLRCLPAGLHLTTRPVCAVRHRRNRLVLGVVRALVLDARARPAASICVGVRGPSLVSCQRAGARTLGRAARRSIAIQNAFAEAMRLRERAIRSFISESPEALLQPSLFDRRVVAEAEHRRRALDRMLGELGRDPDSRAGPSVRISLVGTFPVSR